MPRGFSDKGHCRSGLFLLALADALGLQHQDHCGRGAVSRRKPAQLAGRSRSRTAENVVVIACQAPVIFAGREQLLYGDRPR
jgi:hypothetical protein